MKNFILLGLLTNFHCVKRVRIRSFTGTHLEILRISLYSVRMRENTDQKNSEYRHVFCSVQVNDLFLAPLKISGTFGFPIFSGRGDK